MKHSNSMSQVLEPVTDHQMSVQRVTPTIEGVPFPDEICFAIAGYSPEHDIEIDEHILLPMSEAKRLIGILELATLDEHEHKGIKF